MNSRPSKPRPKEPVDTTGVVPPFKAGRVPGPSGLYWYCPRRAPLPGGGEQGDRRRRGAGPPVASPPAPARLGLQGIFSFLEGAGECIRELVGVGVFGVYECGGYDLIGGGANGPLPMPHTCFLNCYSVLYSEGG